jgi:hypothetical protein
VGQGWKGLSEDSGIKFYNLKLSLSIIGSHIP